MLSGAKHLEAQRDRPFAAAQGDSEGPISSSVLFFEMASSAPTDAWIIVLNARIRHDNKSKY
jgi:hypothetical protein